MKIPDKDYIGSLLINLQFNLYELDLLNGIDKNISVSQRVQLIINEYEKNKHKLYDSEAEYVI